MCGLFVIFFKELERESMYKHRNNQSQELEELPFTDYPSLSSPSFFYKTKQRVGSDKMIILIGLKICLMKRSQEDHLLFLLQQFNCACTRVKLHLISNIVYGEVRIDEGEDIPEYDRIMTQMRLFQVLKEARECFTLFAKLNLGQKLIYSTEQTLEALKADYQSNVIQKVKEKEKVIFSENKRNE